MFVQKILFIITTVFIFLSISKPANAVSVTTPAGGGVSNVVIPVNDDITSASKIINIPIAKDMKSKRISLQVRWLRSNKLPEQHKIDEQNLVNFDKELIKNWAHCLKFTDGREFTREINPNLISNNQLTTIFSNKFFYSIQLPGYFGGAAPNEMILRSFDVPTPLQRTNIIAIDDNVNLWLMTDLNTRQQFFQTALPIIDTEVTAGNATQAWLRLAGEFVWQFNQNPAFNISEKDITSKKLTDGKNKLEITGKAVVVQESNVKGDIIATLMFTKDGKLSSAIETQNIDFSAIPLPPSAAPGGPGGRMLPE